MSFLTIENVSKSYGDIEVLHNISIAVEKGEFLVLVGPSGCGKSTLLNLISGLESISSGTISINGRVVNGVHPSKRNIAMVFQSYALYPNMTVGQNITFGLEMHGIPKEKRIAAMNKVAKTLQIESLLNRKPMYLSGGQRQRVAMGRALVRNPDVFLFDEPLSNLDAKLRVSMRAEIKKIHQQLGDATVVYVTHDQIEALTLSTRIAVMNGGYIQQLGNAQEIYDTPANLFVATFMGSPTMNLMNAKVIVKDSKLYAQVSVANNKLVLLPFTLEQTSILNDYINKKVILGLRPESITDPESAERDAKYLAQIENEVQIVEPAGSDTFVITTMGGNICQARMRSNINTKVGQLLTFTLNMEKAIVFDPVTEMRIHKRS